MNSALYGWCGKIIRIDLSRSAISYLETMDYAGRFLGGRGIATRIYWDEVGPSTGAFDPDNLLILMTGPLGATGAQGASRFEVVGKSPMLRPEGFCYGNLGGFFGPALKRAGYDGIVIRGCAGRPSQIRIHDGHVEILEAASLWGKGTYAVRDALRKEWGDRVHFLTTGVAGENRCRNATLVTDHEGSATAGFGAVMGSKNLKAISVVGTGRVQAAQPKELAELNRYTIHLSKRGTLRMPLPKDKMRYVKRASCYQCGLDCLRGLFRTMSGKESVRKCQSLAFYMPWVFKRPEEPIDTAVDATEICNDAALCTMEMGNLLEWLNRNFRSGALTETETGLPLSKIGTREFLEQLVHMIAYREGFGDLLADGLLRARSRLGRGLPDPFPENVSGIGEEGAYSPRAYVTNALLYPFEPRQHMAMLHEISYMIARWLLHRIRPNLSPTSAEVFRTVAERFWGHPEAWDMTTYAGKAEAAVSIQDRTYAKDSLVLCDSAWPIMDSFSSADHLGDPTLESRLFTAVTGIETDEAGLRTYGERIFNLQRAVLLREGRNPGTSDAPPNMAFQVPVESDPLNPRLLVPGPGEEPVSMKGHVLNRTQFEKMRRGFYDLRGWDPRTGLQRPETMDRLGLSDVAHDLGERGLLAPPLSV